MQAIPIFINSFNRLSYLKQSVEQLSMMDNVEKLVIFDNASTYPPLLEYLNQVDVQVVQSKRNGGPRGAFDYVLQHESPSARKYFVLTDPDLDYSGCPVDLISHLTSVMDVDQKVYKAGPSIHVDDIPEEFPWRRDAINIDGGLQTDSYNDLFWRSSIDTQFAVYRFGHAFQYGPALRAKPPYQIRHIPYYHTPSKMTDEDVWYIQNLPKVFKSGLYWSTLMQDERHRLGIA